MKSKSNTMMTDDGHIRIRIDNQKNRDSVHEIFSAMGCYMHAIEEFNRLVVHSIEPNTVYQMKLDGVEEGSVISKLISTTFSNLTIKAARAIDFTAVKEVGALIESTPEVNEPKDINSIAKGLEATLAKELGVNSGIEPYIDPLKLAEVLMLISDGNELLLDDERVEISNYGNVIPINKSFRSKVTQAKMALTKKEPYRGYDHIKVIRPCNVGTSMWDLKSIVTNDSYSASFHKDCNWLTRYQNGEIPVVTARHTLKVLISYDKYTTGKKSVIKNAIIESVIVNEDPSGEQNEMFS